jgi:hypothetical protein
MAADYNIPVSLSAASTTTATAAQDTSVTFNFASPNATGGTHTVEANPIAPATAVSSASNGGPASSASQGSGVQTGGQAPSYGAPFTQPQAVTVTKMSGLLNSPIFWGVVSLGVVWYLHNKK